MSYRAFLAYNAVGALLWGVGVTFLGFWLGRYAWIGENIDLIFVGIVLVSFVPVGIQLVKNRRRKRSQ